MPGRSDVVYRMLNRDDPPGYGHMLKLGFKTLSERWDQPGSSMNHCMFGHAQEWFQKSVLGIQQAAGSVGFRTIQLAPEPVGDLTSAAGYFDSPRGRINSSWNVEDGNFIWQLAVPPNTSATVYVPAERVEDVREGDTPASEATGVKFVEMQSPAAGAAGSGRAVFEVGSGQYRFRSRLPRALIPGKQPR